MPPPPAHPSLHPHHTCSCSSSCSARSFLLREMPMRCDSSCSSSRVVHSVAHTALAASSTTRLVLGNLGGSSLGEVRGEVRGG